MSPSLILFAIFCVILFIIITDKSHNRNVEKVEGYKTLKTEYAYVPTFEPTWMRGNWAYYDPYRFSFGNRYGYRYPVLYNPLYMPYPYSHRYLYPRRRRRVVHRIVTK